MVIDKEYPATHSMSTSWFGIDRDGKVALLEFEDNGPVPNLCTQASADEIVPFDFARLENNVGYLHYTPEQARELEARLMPPSVADLWWERILKIDTDRTQEFIDICRQLKLPKYHKAYYTVISEEAGLYCVRCDWDESVKHHLIESGIVLGFADFDYIFNDDYDDDNGVWHKNPPMGVPYYLYRQPYNTDHLMELEYRPPYPFTKSQLPKEMIGRGIKFPFSFDDHPRLQIAEYAQCTSYASATYKQRHDRVFEYFELPLEDGGKALFLDNILGDALDRSKLGKPNLTWRDCYEIYTRQMAIYPTVLMLLTPQEGANYEMRTELMPVPHYGFILALLSGPEYYGNGVIRDIASHPNWQKFVDEFKELKFNFEYAVAKLRPNVIVATSNAMHLLKSQYEISCNRIIVSDAEYPIYSKAEAPSHMHIIVKLAQEKYRGTRPRRIIPIKESGK